MPTLSLRTRATAVATLLCAVVLTAGGILLVTTLDRHLTTNSDDLSRSRARDLLDQARAGELPPVLRNVNDDSVAQVIAADGTVLSEKVEPRLASLSFVVGNGAAVRARDFLAVLDKYPEFRDQVRASIYVAERRWNLRL